MATALKSEWRHRPSWAFYFDHSVPCVERYIKRSMNDADSYESVSWDLPVKNGNGTWNVRHTFRGRNMLGGKVIDTKTFIVSKDGQEVLDMYWRYNSPVEQGPVSI